MAAFVLTKANVRIGGTQGGSDTTGVKNLTNFVMSCTLNFTGDLQEETAMGTDGTRSRLSGLKDWSLEMTMKQDFATDGPDDVLFGLVGGNKVFVQVTADGAAVSGTNPLYSGLAVLQDYSPLSGSVGELSTTPANFMASGPLTRVTSAPSTWA